MNESRDEEADDFERSKFLIGAADLATPPAAKEGDREAMLAPTPPSQRPGWRGRGQHRDHGEAAGQGG